jgi:hypothetical protein
MVKQVRPTGRTLWPGAVLLAVGLSGVLPSTFSTSACAGEAEEGRAGEKKEAEKKEKPKIPPFKYSAWCAFREFWSVANNPTEQKQKEIEKDPKLLEREDNSRPASGQWRGFGRRGQWVALVVELENTTEEETYSGDIRVQLDPLGPDAGDKAPYTTRYRQAFELAPKTRQPYPFSVLCPETDFSSIEVNLTANGRSYTRFVTLHDLERPPEDLIVVVSEDAGAFSFLKPPRSRDEMQLPDDQTKFREVAVVQPRDLPDRWCDLTMANLIVVDGPPREELTDRQLEALSTYCQSGGHVLITCGTDPARLRAAEGRRLSVEGLAGVRVRELTKAKSLDLGSGVYDADFELPILDVAPASAAGPMRVYRNLSSKLVEMVERDVGIGSVTFLPFSLRNPRLGVWGGKTQIPLDILKSGRQRVLFTYEDLQPSQGYGPGRGPRWLAYDADPTPPRNTLGGLRSALDLSFHKDTPVETPKGGVVASFLLLYLLVAVPLNYFIFGWWQRREVAWLAVPVWALAGSVMAYVVGYMGQQGRLTLNEVCVIEAGPNQPSAVARTYLCVYAPRADRYLLDFAPHERRAFDVEAGPGHLVSPKLMTRGIEDFLPEMDIWERPDGSLAVEKLQIYSRGTRRLEIAHRVPMGDGLMAEIKERADGQAEIRIRNNTDYNLLNPALIFRAANGELRGVKLGDPPTFQLPSRMAQPYVLPANLKGGGEEMDAAFFGRPPPSFMHARGKESGDRAKALTDYIRDRVRRYEDCVLVAWLDGGVLPMRVFRGEEAWQAVERGFTFLAVPVPQPKAPWTAEYSTDTRLRPDDMQWVPLALEGGCALLSKNMQRGGECVLRLHAPRDVHALTKRQLTLSFKLHGLTAKEFQELFPRYGVGAPPAMPKRYSGKLALEAAEWTSNRTIAQWPKLYRKDAKPGEDRGFSFKDLAPGQSYPVALEMPLDEKRLGPESTLLLKVRVENLSAEGGWQEESWPLALQGFRLDVTGHRVER